MSWGQSYKLDDRRQNLDIIIYYLNLKDSCPLHIHIFWNISVYRRTGKAVNLLVLDIFGGCIYAAENKEWGDRDGLHAHQKARELRAT